MAAYGSLVSLMNTINDIQHHPHPPVSLDKHQIESLTEAAKFFKEFLRTYNPHASYTEEADPLENRIAAASYAAEDAIDLSIKNRSCEVARLALYVVLQRVIYEMDSIKKEAHEIEQRKGVQHDQILQLQSHSSTVGSASRSSSIHQSTTMVGIEKVSYELLEKLIGGNPSCQVIPISGMGGIGKTTLATNVYQHKLVVEHFDIRAWAIISQDFRMKETLLKLHQEDPREMNEYDPREMNEYELGVKLRKELWDRRYLIVLDDIWDIEVWNKLQRYFPDKNNGSRIVLTTRLSKLAHEVTGYESPSLGIEMRFLDEDTSWDLFCKVVFGREDCPRELETIGRKIVESCKGLPLSINVIGGLLAVSAPRQQYWEYVVENLSSIVNSEDNEHCLKILYTSYNSLPVYLKPYFMHMGVFEEDSKIRVSHLIRLWVAEGFVEAVSGKSLEEVAEERLTELVDRNLILVEKIDCLGKLKVCKIHDLLRDLCLREARKHKFLHVLGEAAHSFGIPRDSSGERRIRYNGMNVSVGWKSSIDDRAKMWEIGKLLPPSFRKTLLRVYSIDLVGQQHDPDFVYQRVNFRFLHARSTYPQDSFFSSISICWNLQTLIVDSLSFRTPSSEIWNMSQLRHIEFQYSLELPDPPPTDDVVVLENLQTLSRVKNMKFSNEVIKRIPNIKRLEVVYVGVEQGLHDSCLNNVCHLYKLSSLSLDFKPGSGFSSEMKNMTFPQSLEKLSLRCTYLQWEDMTKMLGSLPLLQVLRLGADACQGVEWHTAEGQFCSLKILEISESNLEYWETESSHFPRLEHLRLIGLRKLKEVPSSIGDISTLQSISLEFCRDSALESAKRIQEEQVEQGNEDLQVQIPNYVYTYPYIPYLSLNACNVPRLEPLQDRLLELLKLKEVHSSMGEISTLQSIGLECRSHSACDSARTIREEQVEQGNEDLQVRLP